MAPLLGDGRRIVGGRHRQPPLGPSPAQRVALAADQPAHGVHRTVDRAIDGERHVVAGLEHHQPRQVPQLDLQLAALVDAAARAVDVREHHLDVADAQLDPVERKREPVPDVLAQRRRERQSMGVDVDSHGMYLFLCTCPAARA